MISRRLKSALLGGCFLLPAPGASAISWANEKVDDPFSDKTCDVNVPMSWGGYIYEYPSKWDGVYWPKTDETWLWECPSGFVAFGQDIAFDEDGANLPEAERARIAAVLDGFGSRSASDTEKRQRLFDIEAVRERGAIFRAELARLKVYWAEDQDKAELRQGARELTILAVPEAEIGPERIQLYFVLGVYDEAAGEPASADKWFEKARNEIWTAEDGTENVGLDYFNALIDEALSNRKEQPE